LENRGVSRDVAQTVKTVGSLVGTAMSTEKVEYESNIYRPQRGFRTLIHESQLVQTRRH
jgi:hypothetical protein